MKKQTRMKHSKRTITVLSVSLIMTVLCLLLPQMSAGRGSQFSKKRTENGFSMGLYPLNHSETEAFELHKGDAIDVSLVVVKGSIAIVIGQEDKEPIYEGNRVECNSFQVTVPEEGTYFITVSGQRAEGSISFQIRNSSADAEDYVQAELIPFSEWIKQ